MQESDIVDGVYLPVVMQGVTVAEERVGLAMQVCILISLMSLMFD